MRQNAHAETESASTRQKSDGPLADRIYEALKDDICSHRLSPGEKLAEAAIAKRFDVSRTPVREAFQRLLREGFISYRPNHGAMVKKSTFDDVSDLFEVSSVLEAYAIEVVTRSISKKDIAYLESLNRKMKDCAEKRDFRGWEQHNREFHDFFISRLNNATLRDILENLRSKMYMSDRDKLPMAIYIEDYIADHERIISAVAGGDATEAARLMKEHICSIDRNIAASR